MRYRPARLMAVISFALLAGGIILFCAVSWRNTIHPAGIVIHHSAVPQPLGGRAVDARVIDSIHKQRGFGVFCWGRVFYIGYHYVILPDGTVQDGRPERCRGAHALGFNAYIGICLVGNFSLKDEAAGEYGRGRPSEAQMRALHELCRRLMADYNIPSERVLTHRNVDTKTDCPGDRFPHAAFIEQL